MHASSQINGTRRITLFRAQDSRALHPYPSTHIARRHSQVVNISRVSPDPTSTAEANETMFGLYDARIKARQMVMRPGDVLTVPSFWWVHEDILSDSIALTVVSVDKKRARAVATLGTLPIPMETSWIDGQLHCALGRFLATLVRLAEPDSRVCQYWY